MKKSLLLFTVLGASALFAAPAGKPETVAEGFPAWQGVTAKNFLTGREITTSDLRHRITMVVEVAPNETLQAQLVKAGDIVGLSQLAVNHFGDNWETRVLPREDICLISVRGGKDVLETLTAAFKAPKDASEEVARALSSIRAPSVPIYQDVILSEPANAEGKYPFVYVLGPTGKDPIYKGVLDEKAVKEVKVLVYKERKKLAAAEPKWTMFFGNLPPEQYPPLLVKTLEKGKAGKPALLGPVAKAIQKDILSKDAEKAKAAQVVFDALEQARGDLVMRIRMEAPECPHRAAYDVQQLLKHWPGEKKRLDAILTKLKAMPEANKLAQMFCKVMVWANPEFTCKNAGEAKKVVAELNKMKKDLEKLKESKVIVVQNGALLMDSQVDELISVIPTRVPEK